jgi:hypothetical protein
MFPRSHRATIQSSERDRLAGHALRYADQNPAKPCGPL